MQINPTTVTKQVPGHPTWTTTYSTVFGNGEVKCNATAANWPPAAFLDAVSTYVITGTVLGSGQQYASPPLNYDPGDTEQPVIVAFN